MLLLCLKVLLTLEVPIALTASASSTGASSAAVRALYRDDVDDASAPLLAGDDGCLASVADDVESKAVGAAVVWAGAEPKYDAALYVPGSSEADVASGEASCVPGWATSEPYASFFIEHSLHIQ